MTPAAGLPWCVPKAAARQWRCSLATRPSGKVFSPASCAAATRCLTGRKTWVRHGRRCAPTSVPSGPCSRLWTTAMARASAPATMKISRSTKRRAFPMAATIAGSRAHCATARDFERPGIASSRTRRAALILASLPTVITWWCCGNTRLKTSTRVTDSNSPPSASTAWRMRRSPTRACSTSTPLRCCVSSNATSSVPRRMCRRTCDEQPGACGHVSATQPFPDREHAVARAIGSSVRRAALSCVLLDADVGGLRLADRRLSSRAHAHPVGDATLARSLAAPRQPSGQRFDGVLLPGAAHRPHSTFANNLFASFCDSRRPIISFGTFRLRSSSWPAVKSPSQGRVLINPLSVSAASQCPLRSDGHVSMTITSSVRRLDRLLADKLLSTGRLSEYPTDYFVGICIETSAVAEQNTLWLPRVDFSDCRLRLLPLEE